MAKKGDEMQQQAASLHEHHRQKVANLKASHKAELEAMISSHKAEIDALKLNHKTEIDSLNGQLTGLEQQLADGKFHFLLLLSSWFAQIISCVTFKRLEVSSIWNFK